ncbi:type III secretion protein [Ideonella sp. YS5]|uniref:type III secretion protein n=1 Tax=Ideonella sp. YS5 TaxID=3453714 RepID=UPI003F6F452B
MPISPISAIDVMQSASAQNGPAQGMAQKFAALMERVPEASSVEASSSSGLGQALLQQDEAMRKSLQDMHALAKANNINANDNEITARQIELTYEIATVQFQFNSGVYLAQSSKNGLQTLMRGQ